jgi:hypothetical protein
MKRIMRTDRRPVLVGAEAVHLLTTRFAPVPGDPVPLPSWPDVGKIVESSGQPRRVNRVQVGTGGLADASAADDHGDRLDLAKLEGRRQDFMYSVDRGA